MVTLRKFEEKVSEVYMTGLIPGLAHPYIGQEAVAVGVCDVLNNDDYIISNHRGHGHSIAKGIEPKEIMAELMGKEGGVVKGLGGSMHSADLGKGVVFSTGYSRRRDPDSDWCRATFQTIWVKASLRLFFWRRRHKYWEFSRRYQSRSDLEIAGHLYLREQSLCHVYAADQSDWLCDGRRACSVIRDSGNASGRDGCS